MTEPSRISHTLPEGYQLEDFEIETVLGIGGFGITYRARDIHLNRSVAIKEYMPSGMAVRNQDAATVFPASDSHRDDFEWGLDRFRKEAETLVAFRHPNIVSVYRFFRANGTAYLVMEYQDGKSLADILGTTNTLSEGEIDEIIHPLLDGLEQVHAAGFMHRDIKPANIFIRRDGKPVLIDFGAARQALGGHSQALTSIVTAGYAPYEQYESDSVQGPWSDIYALGATLYRAVTGIKPVEAPKRAGTVMRGDPDPNTPASELAKGKYSPRLLAAIDAALNVLEDQRPQSVEEFRAYLAGTARAEADTALNESPRPASDAHRTAEGATLFAGAAGASGRAAAPAGAAAGGTRPPIGARGGPGQPPVPEQHTPVEPYKPSRRAWLWPVVGVAAFLVVGGAAAGVYVVVDEQRQEDERQRLAEARRQAELKRQEAERQETERREAERRRAEARRQAEEERRKREADMARRNAPGTDLDKMNPNPDDTNPDNTNPRPDPGDNVPREEEIKPEDYRPQQASPTVGEPGGIVGRWCSPSSHITFSPRSIQVHILKSGWKRAYNVTRYNITPTVVTVSFSGGSAGTGIFVFNRERHSTVQMTLKRAFFGKRWRNMTTYFTRSC